MLRRPIASTVSRLGLELLLDANSLSSGVLVSTWPDLSGNGRNATQNARNSQPACSLSYPAVVFDGVDDSLILPRLDLADCTVVAFTARLPMSWQIYSTLLQIVSSSNTKDAIRLQANDHNVDGPLLVGAGGDGSAGYNAGGLLKLGTKRVLVATKTGSTVTLYDNNSLVTTSTSTIKATNTAGTDSRLGAVWGSPSGTVHRHWCGPVGLLAIYSRVISADERAYWHSYAQTNGWGL